MNKNLSKLLLICGLIIPLLGVAQDKQSFSLDDAIQFAIEHNYNMKNARTDVEIAKKKINETTAIGLPQINASISNTNFINQSVTLIPDFITPNVVAANEDYFDLTVNPDYDPDKIDFFAATFGAKHSANATISVSQLIFKGSYLVGLQAAKAFLEQSKVQVRKSEIDVRESVTNAYFLVLVAEEQLKILSNTMKSLKETRDETAKIFEQGFIEDTDVDQLDLMLADLEASIYYANNQLVIARSYLKLNLGLRLNYSITLTDKLIPLLGQIKDLGLLTSPFSFSSNIDYKILQNQKRLSELNLKNFKSEYLPSISAFFNYQKDAQRNGWNFFNTSEQWYGSEVYGFTMDIPIFASGMKKAKIQQAKLELQKINQLDYQLQSSLGIAHETATNNFRNTLSIHFNKNKSKFLSNKIYKKAQLKYKEGVYSSLDLLQNYNQFLESESNYISSIIDLVSAKLALEKLFAE